MKRLFKIFVICSLLVLSPNPSWARANLQGTNHAFQGRGVTGRKGQLINGQNLDDVRTNIILERGRLYETRIQTQTAIQNRAKEIGTEYDAQRANNPAGGVSTNTGPHEIRLGEVTREQYVSRRMKEEGFEQVGSKYYSPKLDSYYKEKERSLNSMLDRAEKIQSLDENDTDRLETWYKFKDETYPYAREREEFAYFQELKKYDMLESYYETDSTVGPYYLRAGQNGEAVLAPKSELTSDNNGTIVWAEGSKGFVREDSTGKLKAFSEDIVRAPTQQDVTDANGNPLWINKDIVDAGKNGGLTLEGNAEVWQMDGKTFNSREEFGQYLMEQQGYTYDPQTGTFNNPNAEKIALEAFPGDMETQNTPAEAVEAFQKTYPASEQTLPDPKELKPTENPENLPPPQQNSDIEPKADFDPPPEPDPIDFSNMPRSEVTAPPAPKVTPSIALTPPKIQVPESEHTPVKVTKTTTPAPKSGHKTPDPPAPESKSSSEPPKPAIPGTEQKVTPPTVAPQIFNNTSPAATTNNSSNVSFGSLYDPLKKLYDAVITDFAKARVLVYLCSGFGLIAVAVLAIFGKLRLQWLVTIVVSLFLLASTEGIIEYIFNAGTGKTPAGLSSKNLQTAFGNNSNNLTFRNDSGDFNYDTMKASHVNSEKTLNTIVDATSRNFNFQTEQQKWDAAQEFWKELDASLNPFGLIDPNNNSYGVFTPFSSYANVKVKEKMFFDNFRILLETFVNLRLIVYLLSGFALVGFAFLAIMGKLDWALFTVIAISLFTLAGTEALVTYAFDAGNGNPSKITADWASKQFNKGTSDQLKLRDDSNDFNYQKMLEGK